jgi:hypothetical protein
VYSIQDCYPNHGIGSYPCNLVTEHLRIDEKKSGNILVIYPNPTSGEFSVFSSQFSVENVEIFDVFGRKQCKVSRVTCNEIINISHLAEGIYFIRITTETGTVTKKVIKQ